ncbi:MAG: hypothetical protein QW491_10000 [Thermoproteota archaeon]
MLQGNRVQEVQEGLEKLLEKLKKKTNLGLELEVEWIPGYVKHSKEGRILRGEILGNKILVYDQSLKDAKETLVHEFVEYLLTLQTRPYRNLVTALVGALISVVEDQAYDQRDKVAKAVTKLIFLPNFEDLEKD